MQDAPPELEELLRQLSEGSCPHAAAIPRLSAMLLAAALRHGGSLTFDFKELEEAIEGRALSLVFDGNTKRAVVQALRLTPGSTVPTHPAPGGLQ